jgi:hypothetical protein
VAFVHSADHLYDSVMSMPINTHSARTALNNDYELRQWAEEWLKSKERAAVAADMPDEEFEKHWRYVRPERMHEGAVEAVAAYRQRQEEH